LVLGEPMDIKENPQISVSVSYVSANVIMKEEMLNLVKLM
jgi:hypothetical protein